MDLRFKNIVLFADLHSCFVLGPQSFQLASPGLNRPTYVVFVVVGWWPASPEDNHSNKLGLLLPPFSWSSTSPFHAACAHTHFCIVSRFSRVWGHRTCPVRAKTKLRQQDSTLPSTHSPLLLFLQECRGTVKSGSCMNV